MEITQSMRLEPLDRRLGRSMFLASAKSHLKVSQSYILTVVLLLSHHGVLVANRVPIVQDVLLVAPILLAATGIQLPQPHKTWSETTVCLEIPREPTVDHSEQILMMFPTKFVIEDDLYWMLFHVKTFRFTLETNKVVYHVNKASSALCACQKDCANRG